MTDIRPELIKRESDMHHFECLPCCRHERTTDGGPELPGRGSILVASDVSSFFHHILSENKDSAVLGRIWEHTECKLHQYEYLSTPPPSVRTEAKWIFPRLHHSYPQSGGFSAAVNCS